MSAAWACGIHGLMAMCCSIPTLCYSFAVGNGTSMFFRYESPCPDVSIYYWPKLSCPCSTVPRRPVVLRLQEVTWGLSPEPRRPAARDSPQPFSSEASEQSFWPSHSGFSFDTHCLLRQVNKSPGQLPGDSKASVTCVFCRPPSSCPLAPPGATTTVSVLTLLPGSASVPMGCSRQLSCSSC